MAERAVVILRLGQPEPCGGDFEVMKKLSDGDLKQILGCSVPFGVMSILNTDKSNEDIVELFKGVEADDDNYPVLVWDLDSPDFCIYLAGLQPRFNELKKAYYETLGDLRKKEPVLKTIDEVLDKINKDGIDSLSESELALLKGGQ